MAGLTDVFATVTVPKPEYEKLVKENERLRIIEAMLKKNNYVSTDDMKIILNISDITESEVETNGN